MSFELRRARRLIHNSVYSNNELYNSNMDFNKLPMLIKKYFVVLQS